MLAAQGWQVLALQKYTKYKLKQFAGSNAKSKSVGLEFAQPGIHSTQQIACTYRIIQNAWSNPAQYASPRDPCHTVTFGRVTGGSVGAYNSLT